MLNPIPCGSSRKAKSIVQTAHETLQGIDYDGIAFRLLDALLTHAPTVEGVDVIATDIIEASAEPDGLEQLADFYKTGLLLPVKASGRTPDVSFHPSRDQEIESEADGIVPDFEAAQKDPRTLKKYTLHRDGHRCVVTRKWDFASLSIPQVWEKFNRAHGTTITQAAHILPLSLMSIDANKKLFKKAMIRTVIKSFTNMEFMELNGAIINSLTNVITLDSTVHTFFGMLNVWFEAVPDMPHTYKIWKAPDYILSDIEDGTQVTFTSSSPQTLPLPDPRYLAFHAALAKVIHMAGLAEHLEDIIRRYRNIRLLSDESNVEHLDGLLRVAQRYPVAR